MKKSICYLIILLLCVPTAEAQTRVDSLVSMLKSTSRDYVFVVSHRGDWRNAPENSIDAIERVIALGADVVELDIQRTKDGQFVLMHDTTLDRTTTGNGYVRDYTVDELKQLKLKSGNGIKTYDRIPTLKEGLLAAKGRILVNIDKGGTYIKEILPIIKETGTASQVIIKGKYPVSKVLADYGDNSGGMLYMPIVDFDLPGAEAMIDDFNKNFKPVAFEVLFKKENNKLLSSLKKTPSEPRLWINTLWDSMCGNHDDELAIRNPDAHWGWVVAQQATIIQTDRTAELIGYLKSKNLRKMSYHK